MSIDSIHDDLKHIETPENLTPTIIRCLLATYNAEEVFYTLKEKYGIDIEVKINSSIHQEDNYKPYSVSINNARNDEEFKRAVRARFQSCIICGYEKSNCDVAHIYDFNKCRNNSDECYDPENGLLLCPNHHRLFDKGYLKFNEIENPDKNIEVKIHYKVISTEISYDNKRLKFTSKNIYYLRKKYEIIGDVVVPHRIEKYVFVSQ